MISEIVVVGTLGAVEAVVTREGHTPTECRPDNQSAHFHTKSWSYRFTCPTCGKSKRQNTNYLGRRRTLVCDGEKIYLVMKSAMEARR